MNAPSKINYYEVLNVAPGASRQEIRESYVRLKQTYSSTNQALYSLLNDEETAQMNLRVEEAFRILNDDFRRRHYDQNLGIEPEPEESSQQRSFVVDPFSGASASRQQMSETLPRGPRKTHLPSPLFKSAQEMAAKQAKATDAHKTENQEKAKALISEFDLGDGKVFRALRELHQVSEDEMQDRIKVSLEYIRAIETNFFERLPRPVFVKGFLRSYCKYLAVPEAEPLIAAFMTKFEVWQKDT